MNGTEPHFKWKTFSKEVIDLCVSMNVSSVVTLGALLDSIPHTRGVKTQITGQHEFMPEGFTQKKIGPSKYEGPTGITSVIIEDFKKIASSCWQEKMLHPSAENLITLGCKHPDATTCRMNLW